MTNYSLVFLEKENDLNKLLREEKRNRHRKGELALLYTSLWDDPSIKLVESLQDKYTVSENSTPLYIINNFTMLHAFVIFKTTKLPHLVKLKGDRVFSTDYLPEVHRKLGV